MPWAAAAAVASAGMNYVSNKKSAEAQLAAGKAGQDYQERIYEQQRKDFQPYMQAGYKALDGLQGLTDPTQRGKMLAEYYESPEFAAMSDMSATEKARLGAVTGGLRSGEMYRDLESIRPQLGQQFLTNQYNQLTGLANLGMGATSQGAQAAGQYGQNMNLSQIRQGDIYAQQQLANANIYGDLASTLGGIFKQQYGSPLS